MLTPEEIAADINWLAIRGWLVQPVGSRVTCNPAPEGTDRDYLVFVASQDEAAAVLFDAGFSQDGSPEFYTGNDAGGFRSYRRGAVNIIATEDYTFFERFLIATGLARRFNLLDKADRIALFQAVLYGVAPDDSAGALIEHLLEAVEPARAALDAEPR